jgi:CxxC motif-containing protein
MELRKICIICPRGCHLRITTDAENAFLSVSGNLCQRGENYALEEVNHPSRVITTTVKLRGGELNRVPIKTCKAIPLNLVTDFITHAKNLSLDAPVSIGDILIVEGNQMDYECVVGRTVHIS